MAGSDEDDLRINTLHALSKHSPSLVLEEHGHCEVPAGCGGVVLRWRDPAAGTPAVLSVVADAASLRASLDGDEIPTAWLQIRPGARRLTLELRGVRTVPSPLLVLVARQGRDGADRRAPPLYASGAGWVGRPLDRPEAPLVPLAAADDLLAERLASRDQGWRWRDAHERGAQPLRLDWPDAVVVFDLVHREDA